MKRSYTDTQIQRPTKALLEKILDIVDEYQNKKIQMTTRQIYYQLVAKGQIENISKNYQKVSRACSIGRMHGLIDWGMIIDTGRTPRMPNEFTDLAELLNTAKDSYAKQRWYDQDNYVEVLVEKDALTGVLDPITRGFHVSLLANRGYLSTTATYNLANRISEQSEQGKNCYILYLGDHDPSGLDMVRDIGDRLKEFGVIPTIKRLALTEAQIMRYKLPPNPAKTRDPRFADYTRQIGGGSWELDALKPEVLVGIVETAINDLLDKPKYERVVKEENDDKMKLATVIKLLGRGGI